MSRVVKSDDDSSFNIDELLQIGTMCRELRKEKDMLKESQSKSTEVIRRLELNIKSLSEGRSDDAKYIQQLERELGNCSEEIGYLQDQLNLRNVEANYLGEHVHSLELKLLEVEKLREKVSQLKEEILKSNSERLFLMWKLENKEIELQNSTLCIQKLEEMISSIALESECEIESIKLDLIAFERTSVEAREFQERNAIEKKRMEGLVEMLAHRFQGSQKMIESLEKENKELRAKLETSESNSTIFLRNVEEHLSEWLESKDGSPLDIQSYNESELPWLKEIGTREEGLGPLLSKLAVVATSSKEFKSQMENMLHQIHEYERLKKQLQDELMKEKSKAKEEAEDLAQEMAELRYQLMGMLEEECKRRACIEQASLQRIAELEAQVRKEQGKSFIAVKRFLELQKLVEPRSMEIQSLQNLLEEPCTSPRMNETCNCGGC